MVSLSLSWEVAGTCKRLEGEVHVVNAQMEDVDISQVYIYFQSTRDHDTRSMHQIQLATTLRANTVFRDFSPESLKMHPLAPVLLLRSCAP